MPYSSSVRSDPRMTMVISGVGILGGSVHIALIPFFLWLGIDWLAALNVLSIAAWAYGWSVNRRGDQAMAILVMTGEVMVHTLAAVSAIGFQSGFQYYLIGGVSFTLFNSKLKMSNLLAIVSAMVLLFIALYLIDPSADFVFPSQGVLRGLHVLNAVIAFTAIVLASYYFRDATLRAEAKLEALATTDALTGAPNRRRMVELLEQERARARQTGAPFAVILGDVDHFKAFNDTHGHECGDRALQAVTEAISSRLRATDVLGRWGGEEFLVLLPSGDAHAPVCAGEALRDAVASRRVRFGGCDLPITMTFGVATSAGDEPIESVLCRADAALYAGKERGRNTVVAAGDARTSDGLPSPKGRPSPASAESVRV